MEKPELRTFEGNPMRDILADRGKYIAAALTICRAYIVAGRPERRTQLASFNEWSDTVRSALVWLGEADPVDSMDTSRAEDPEKIALVTMLTEWKSTLGAGEKKGVALRVVIDHASRIRSIDPITKAVEYEHPGLRSAVLAVMPASQPDRRRRPREVDAREEGPTGQRHVVRQQARQLRWPCHLVGGRGLWRSAEPGGSIDHVRGGWGG